MPPNISNDKFKNNINQLHLSFNGPLFDPHVTLIGGFLGKEKALIDKTESVAKKISPFKLSLTDISYSSQFFQSLFINVKLDQQLVDIRNTLCKEFDFKEKNFIPHLSLIYGDYNLSEKERMVSMLKPMPNYFKVNKIYLAYNDEINLRWKIINDFTIR